MRLNYKRKDFCTANYVKFNFLKLLDYFALLHLPPQILLWLHEQALPFPGTPEWQSNESRPQSSELTKY